MVWMARRPQPLRARADHERRRRRARSRAEGVVAAFSGADLAERVAGGASRAPGPSPRTRSSRTTGRSPTDKARYVGDGVAVVIAESRALGEGRSRAGRGRLRAAAGRDRRREGARRRRAARPRRVRHATAATRGSSRPARSTAVREGRRHRQGALPPAAADPERDRAARRARRSRRRRRASSRSWSATQIPHILRVTLSHRHRRPGGEAARGRAGRRRRLRLEARTSTPRRRSALVLARRLGRPVKWTRSAREGYLATIHGRDHDPGDRARGRPRTGRSARFGREARRSAMGAYLQLVTPGIPLLGAWLYARLLRRRRPTTSTCIGVFTNTTPTDAYRGAGRPEATYAIERAVDALARKLGKDPVELRRLNFITGVPARRSPPGSRSTPATTTRALDAALEMLGYDELRRSRPSRSERGRHEAARHRLLDLHRDVRPRAVADPRRDPLRRPAAGTRPRSAASRPGTVQVADRHLAARAGPRDDVLPDRRRPARRPDRGRRGAPRRHGRRAARHGHVRQPQPRRRRRRRSTTRPRR